VVEGTKVVELSEYDDGMSSLDPEVAGDAVTPIAGLFLSTKLEVVIR